MSSSNEPSWIDDLFGGRDKAYGDNGERISQDSEDRESGGEYPHHTYDGDNWHYSTDRGSKGTHTQETFHSSDESNDNSSSEGEGNSFDLFDPSSWF
jgi:hypothetical protein